MLYMVFLTEKGKKERKVGEYKTLRALQNVVDDLWNQETTKNVRIFKEVSWGEQMSMFDGENWPF